MTKGRRSDSAFFNRSLERALQILDSFNNARKTASTTELCQLLKLPKATVMRLCSTLVKYNYLKQDPVSKVYSLGLRLFELGSVVLSSFSLVKTASPHLTKLQERLGKTVFLSILDNDQLLYIDKKEDLRHPIRFTSSVGDRLPPYWGMSGPLLMAYLPEAEVERLLRRYPLMAHTRKSITDKWQFKEWLGRIRKQGFSIDEGMALEGISGVAAPIRDREGNVIAGVGVGFISSSVDSKGLKRLIQDVIETASAISRDLLYVEKT